MTITYLFFLNYSALAEILSFWLRTQMNISILLNYKEHSNHKEVFGFTNLFLLVKCFERSGIGKLEAFSKSIIHWLVQFYSFWSTTKWFFSRFEMMSSYGFFSLNYCSLNFKIMTFQNFHTFKVISFFLNIIVDQVLSI